MKGLLFLSVLMLSFSIQMKSTSAQTALSSFFDDADYIGFPVDSLLIYMELVVNKNIEYKPLFQTAQKVQKNTTEFQLYIDELRERMVKESGGVYTYKEALKAGYPILEGKPKGKKDKETPNRIFVTGDYGADKKVPQGPILAQKIKALKNVYLNSVSDLWKEGGVKNTFFEKASQKQKILDALLSKISLEGDEGYEAQKHRGKSWSEFTFGYMPVAAIYPMLRKFQNDAKNSEAMVIYLLVNQMGGLNIPVESKKYMQLANRNLVNLSNDYSFSKLEKAVKEKPKYQLLYETARKVKILTSEFKAYINELRSRMYEESGGVYTVSEAVALGHANLAGRPKGKVDKDTPHRIFITGDYGKQGKRKAEGVVLAKKIRTLKAAYITLIEDLWNGEGVPNTVFSNIVYKDRLLEKLKRELFLTSDENWDATKHEGKSWSEFIFGEMPVAAVAPMLRKFEYDAQASEGGVLDFLVSQVEN